MTRRNRQSKKQRERDAKQTVGVTSPVVVEPEEVEFQEGLFSGISHLI